MAATEKLSLRCARGVATVILSCCLVEFTRRSVLHAAVATADGGFTFNGFRGANLTLDGMAGVTPEGLLQLSDATKMLGGQAFYPSPIRLNTSPRSNGSASVPSFSTTFVFGIQYTMISGHGILFVFTPTIDFQYAHGSQYLGIFNASNYRGSPANRIVTVEIDTVLNPEFEDMNDNHIGINVNGIISQENRTAGYYPPDGGFRNLNLSSGERMQVWVDYDAVARRMTVTLAPFGEPKPGTPLLSQSIDLSQHIFDDCMYLGFSSSTGPFPSSHYITGWSFSTSVEAKLNLSALPSLPRGLRPPKLNRTRTSVIFLATSIVLVSVLTLAAGGAYWAVTRKRKYAELTEDWELDYGAHRFRYKVLFDATDGFSDDRLLGSGGFGSVYRGVLPTTKAHVAVKKVSHESRQGMREFVAEIVSIGRIRHRNVVQLLGYCRRRGELLLVYEMMPNGSLDKLLFSNNRDGIPPPPLLDWKQRFHVINGVASGLRYLHEEWEQVVLHRDIKASNVLLDGDLNGRLGDFGLARLYDHGTDPHTTHVMGTMGYLAPEMTKTSKATKATDVFAFGTFLLEVATGRRPIQPRSPDAEVILVDWVLEAYKRGVVIEVADARLGGQFEPKEMETVLILGLICCHPLVAARPAMKHVVRLLDPDGALPELSTHYLELHASRYA